MLNIPDPKKLAAAFGSVQKIDDSVFKAVHKLLGLPMTERELNEKLADPKLSPEQKKRLQDEYNKRFVRKPGAGPIGQCVTCCMDGFIGGLPRPGASKNISG